MESSKEAAGRIFRVMRVDLSRQWITEDLRLVDKPKSWFGRLWFRIRHPRAKRDLSKVADAVETAVGQLDDAYRSAFLGEMYVDSLRNLLSQLHQFDETHTTSTFQRVVSSLTTLLSSDLIASSQNLGEGKTAISEEVDWKRLDDAARAVILEKGRGIGEKASEKSRARWLLQSQMIRDGYTLAEVKLAVKFHFDEWYARAGKQGLVQYYRSEVRAAHKVSIEDIFSGLTREANRNDWRRVDAPTRERILALDPEKTGKELASVSRWTETQRVWAQMRIVLLQYLIRMHYSLGEAKLFFKPVHTNGTTMESEFDRYAARAAIEQDRGWKAVEEKFVGELSQPANALVGLRESAIERSKRGRGLIDLTDIDPFGTHVTEAYGDHVDLLIPTEAWYNLQDAVDAT